MEIRVDKLRRVLALLQPDVPRKTTVTATLNARFMEGRVTSTDLETAVQVDMREIGGDAFLLPFKRTVELLKFVPGDLVLKIEPQDKSVKLSWPGGSAAFMVPPVGDFPEIPDNEPLTEAVMDGDRLISALMNALPYASGEEAKDGGRRILNGVAVFLGDTVQVAAADGFRVTFESVRLSFPVKETIVLNQATIRILEHLWHKEPGRPAMGNSLVAQLTASRPLTLGIWPEHLRVKFGDITVMASLITGTFPDILNLLGTFKEEQKIQFMAPDLYVAVRRMANIAKLSSGIVRLQWTDSTLTVSASSIENGEVTADVPITAGATPGRIAINVRYLIEYLSDKQGFVTMGTASRTTPAVLHFGDRPLVALMPMKASWDDDPKEEPKAEAPAAAAPAAEADEAAEGETKEGEGDAEEGEGETEPAAAETIAQEPEPVEAAVAGVEADEHEFDP